MLERLELPCSWAACSGNVLQQPRLAGMVALDPPGQAIPRCLYLVCVCVGGGRLTLTLRSRVSPGELQEAAVGLPNRRLHATFSLEQEETFSRTSLMTDWGGGEFGVGVGGGTTLHLLWVKTLAATSYS